SDLLSILRITKQSLSRVLSKLIQDGFITQKSGVQDRRRRLLSLTIKGEELERRLTLNQRERVARAYREAGADAVEGYKKVLLGIINTVDHRQILDRVKMPNGMKKE
ncbi:MAG: MarR family transcriptional regulator, partial [Rhodospirillaceae bacterium]